MMWFFKMHFIINDVKKKLKKFIVIWLIIIIRNKEMSLIKNMKWWKEFYNQQWKVKKRVLSSITYLRFYILSI